MRAMVLAAGRGERFRPISDSVPKPLIPVQGRPLIERHLFGLAAAGVTEVVINLGWLGEKIEAALGDGGRFGVHIAYSDEGWPALDTGGGVYRALPMLGRDPFLLINGDVWTDYPLSRLVAGAEDLTDDTQAHLVLVPNPPHKREGDFALESNRIVTGTPCMTFSGLSVLRPELFEGCREVAFPLLRIWQRGIAEGRITGEVYTGIWCDVGTPERLVALERMLNEPTGC